MTDYRQHYGKQHRVLYRRKVSDDHSRGRKCTACNIQFESLKEYRVHYRQTHARKRPSDTDPLSKVVCPHCGVLKGKKSIGKHIKMKHSNETNPRHECKTCGKTYASIAGFITHTRMHTNDKR